MGVRVGAQALSILRLGGLVGETPHPSCTSQSVAVKQEGGLC